MPNAKRFSHLIPLTHDRLMQVVSYDQISGVFTRNASPSNAILQGAKAGSLNGKGYVIIDVDRKTFLAHRLAWFYIHGVWPVGQIDHINGERTDNCIKNLRVVDNSTNQQNKKSARSDSRTGIIGVHLHVSGRYQAKINIGGKQQSLGMFITAIEAQDAYLKCKRQYHAGCTI